MVIYTEDSKGIGRIYRGVIRITNKILTQHHKYIRDEKIKHALNDDEQIINVRYR